MGTKGREMVGKDVEKLISLLNKALADEWLAYYQYWIGSRIAEGPMRGAVEAELREHAAEELEHAEMLAERIIILGGTPVLDPKDWQTLTNCGYETPEDPSVKKLLEQNVKAEQCAIKVYRDILKEIKGSEDYITFNMIRKIMEDEVEHEEDLQALQKDMEKMKM